MKNTNSLLKYSELCSLLLGAKCILTEFRGVQGESLLRLLWEPITGPICHKIGMLQRVLMSQREDMGRRQIVIRNNLM